MTKETDTPGYDATGLHLMSLIFDEQLLRRALTANVAFSSLSALASVWRAPSLSEHLALSSSEFVGLGAQLAIFAALILWLATRPRLSRRWCLVLAALVSASDLLWTAGSLVALAAGIAWTVAGGVIVIGCAVATALLGYLQARSVIALWKHRARPAPAAARPPWGRRLRRGAAIAGGTAGFILLLYLLLPWADLRAEAVRKPSEPETAQAAGERGRELLRACARTHGLEAVEARETMEVVAVDDWGESRSWWPAPTQRFRAERLLGTFTSRVELLDGPEAGQIRGIQSWRPYRRPTPKGSLDTPVEDLAITFYLPTLQYFDELPFRLLAAPVVVYAGEAEAGGRRFERVFVTWNKAAPHAANDQYEVWLDPSTYRLEKAVYTLRDALDLSPAPLGPLMRVAAIGTMHYDDYRKIDGVLVSFRQTVTIGTPKSAPSAPDSGYAHRLVVESARFDTVDPDALLPLDGLAAPGDAKPGR